MILARICDKTADSSVNVPATDENFLISVGIVQSIRSDLNLRKSSALAPKWPF